MEPRRLLSTVRVSLSTTLPVKSAGFFSSAHKQPTRPKPCKEGLWAQPKTDAVCGFGPRILLPKAAQSRFWLRPNRDALSPLGFISRREISAAFVPVYSAQTGTRPALALAKPVAVAGFGLYFPQGKCPQLESRRPMAADSVRTARNRTGEPGASARALREGRGRRTRFVPRSEGRLGDGRRLDGSGKRQRPPPARRRPDARRPKRRL